MVPDEGGRKAAHPALAIVKAEAVAQLGAVAGQIDGAQHPGVGRVGVHLGHHGLGQRAAIEGVRPLACQGTQHLGQGRVGQPAARRSGAAVGLIEVGPRIRVFCKIGILGQQRGQPRAYHESLLREGDGGLEQAGPGQLAVTLVGQRQCPHRAGGAHRAPAHHAVVEGHRLAILHEQLIGGGGGGRLATIHGGYLFAVPHQHEGATADAGGLRLHQGQHQLHRDGGIHRTAAGLDHLVARLHRQRVGGSHHEVVTLPALLLLPAAGGLRRDQGVGGGRLRALLSGAAGQQSEGDGQPQRFAQHDTLLVCFMSMKGDYVTIGANDSSCRIRSTSYSSINKSYRRPPIKKPPGGGFLQSG